MKKKKLLKSIITATAGFAVLSSSFLLSGEKVSAHGYVEKPASRGYMGKLERDIIGYTAAFEKYGDVINNPQSLEWEKGFPEAGPVDGQIASAQGTVNQQIKDQVLDFQTIDRWKKTDLNGGPNTFTWHYDAVHATTKWDYYITKKGWDPNAPLARNEFEHLKTIEHHGQDSSTYPTHTVNLPTDRNGYYVVLAVWTIDNTDNAFYQVIDVNLHNDGSDNGSGDTEKPSKVTGINATNITTNSADLTWDASTDNEKVVEYQIYRDGKLINKTSETHLRDEKLKENTTYHYTITAKDAADNVSEVSDTYSLTTAKAPEEDVLPPSVPTGLHSMGTTSSKVSLMWGASTDNVGVDKYEIYRNGQFLKSVNTTAYDDETVEPDTDYNYYVVAVDGSGNKSGQSNVLNVHTEKGNSGAGAPSMPGNAHVEGLTATEALLKWDASTGDKEIAGYKIYTGKDGSQIADVKSTQFKLENLMPNTLYAYFVKSYDVDGNLSTSSAPIFFVTPSEDIPGGDGDNTGFPAWDMAKTYHANDKVSYKGTVYVAGWQLVGENPEVSNGWTYVSGAIPAWNELKEYKQKDKVAYKGKTYQAKWSTRGTAPDTSYGPWELVSE